MDQVIKILWEYYSDMKGRFFYQKFWDFWILDNNLRRAAMKKQDYKKGTKEMFFFHSDSSILNFNPAFSSSRFNSFPPNADAGVQTPPGIFISSTARQSAASEIILLVEP